MFSHKPILSRLRRGQKNRWAGALAGAAGGVVAAFVMNRFQAVWTSTEKEFTDESATRSAESGDDATVKAAAGISRNVLHHELTNSEKKWAGPAVHYAFGGLIGGLYGALANATPVSGLSGGAAYGSAIWLLADEIAVPSAGLSQAPFKTPMKSHLKAWASHLVYGFVTDLTRRTILKTLRA